MSSVCIVVSDVLGHFLLGDVSVLVRCHFQFCLQGAKARLHERIIVAVIGATHTLFHASAVQQLAVLRTRILASAIGVMNQIG